MSENWKSSRIDEVCSVIKRGIGPKYTEESDGVPVLNQRCIREQKVSFENARLNDLAKKRIPEDRYLKSFDVLINSTGVGTLGRVAQIGKVENLVTVDSHVTIVRLCDMKIDPHFFGMAMRYRQMLFEALGEGSTGQTELSRYRVGEISIDYPSSISEQKAIANILGRLDDKIELNRRMNQTLEAMAQALFKSWFVDFDPVLDNALAAGPDSNGWEIPDALESKAEKRKLVVDSKKLLHKNPELAALFPSSFVFNETLGKWIPEGWEVNHLGNLLDVIETGRRPKGGVSKYSEGVPSVGAESINGIGHFEFSKTKYVPVEFFENMSAGKVEDHDVLLYKDGGKPGDFKPRIGMFGDDFPFTKYGINEHVFRLRSASLGQFYLYHQISSKKCFHELAVMGGKAAIPGVNQSEVKSLEFLTPPNEILNQFNQIVENQFGSILKKSKESLTLAKLRDTLLPKLISGKVRVPITKLRKSRMTQIN